MTRSFIAFIVVCTGLFTGCNSPEATPDSETASVANSLADSVLVDLADPADVESIEAIIKAYYEVVSGPAGSVPDKKRDQSLHHPDHWIAIANTNSEGQPGIRAINLDDFYGDLDPRKEGFFEWETERVVQRHQNMASVWSHYASSKTEGGEPFTTGVNTITLWFDGTRWWVMNWMFDTSSG